MRAPDRLSPDELYDAVVALGVETDHHASDLYVRATPEVAELLARYRFVSGVTTFLAEQGDGTTRSWYAIPFAYKPFWVARSAPLDR